MGNGSRRNRPAVALDVSFLLVICDKPRVRPHLPHAEAEREEPHPPVLTRLSAAVQPGGTRVGRAGCCAAASLVKVRPLQTHLSCASSLRQTPCPRTWRSHDVICTLRGQIKRVPFAGPLPAHWAGRSLRRKLGSHTLRLQHIPLQVLGVAQKTVDSQPWERDKAELWLLSSQVARANWDRCLPAVNQSPGLLARLLRSDLP